MMWLISYRLKYVEEEIQKRKGIKKTEEHDKTKR